MTSLKKSKNLEKSLNICSYVIFSVAILTSIVLTICLRFNILTLISCITGILYICLLSGRNIFNFLVGLASTITYIVVAFKSNLFGEALFYLVFDLPMIIVSVFLWRKNIKDDFTVEAKKLPLKIWITIILAGAIFSIAYSFFLKAIGGTNVYLDAVSTVVSVIATLLMAFRYREQWFMWIIVYAISIALWSTTFDLLMLVMSICCFISSIIGCVIWSLNKNLQKDNPKDLESKKG